MNKIKKYFTNQWNMRFVCNTVLALVFMNVLFFSANISAGANRLIGFICIIVAYTVCVILLNLLFHRLSAQLGMLSCDGDTLNEIGSPDFFAEIKLPILITDENGIISAYNKAFAEEASVDGIFSRRLTGENSIEFLGIDTSTLFKDESESFGKTEISEPVDISCFGKSYRVIGYRAKNGNDTKIITVWNDRSEVGELYKRLYGDSLVVSYIMIDNLDELMQFVADNYRTVYGEIENVLKNWAKSVNGIIKEYEKERYIFVFEASHLAEFQANKFDIIDRIRSIRVGDGNMPVTVSIGVSGTGGSFADKEKTARAALDMALQRGGDQVVMRTDSGLEFYGGRSKGVSKRTKVRARVIANALAGEISKSSNVIIMGHRNADFDSIGSCAGLARLAMFCGVKVNIVVNDHDPNIIKALNILRDLPDYSGIFVNSSVAQDMLTSDTLLIISDVNNPEQFEAPDIARNAFNTVIIDHHRKTAEYDREPVITYIEPSASSASELVSEILEQSVPAGSLTKEEADVIFAGIMLDTKQFSRNTHTRTFSAALYLRSEGADPTDAQYFFKTELEDFRREAIFESNIEIYRSIIAISENEAESEVVSERVAAAKAADKLLTIENVEASFAICKIGNTTHISARSAGVVNVQLIIEKLGGGGRFDAAATQMVGVSLTEAKTLLYGAIDSYFEIN